MSNDPYFVDWQGRTEESVKLSKRVATVSFALFALGVLCLAVYRTIK
jgi:hypothetical protein